MTFLCYKDYSRGEGAREFVEGLFYVRWSGKASLMRRHLSKDLTEFSESRGNASVKILKKGDKRAGTEGLSSK